MPSSLPASAALTSAPAPSPSLAPDLGGPVRNTGVQLAGAGDLAVFAAQIGLAALGAYLVAVVMGVVLRRAGRRSPLVQSLSRHTRRPFRALLVLVAVRVAVGATAAINPWVLGLNVALGVLIFTAAAWLLVGTTATAEDEVVRRYRVDVEDNRHARRVRTQTSFIRRLVVAAIIVVAVGVVLLTVVPGASRVGTVLLSSAGLLSVVAGLAAQSALGNVFAGLQIAFTDALRVEDVVVVESQFGRVEEITLTYVVVRLWDERRMVLPSTFFTTTPFENWTRRDSALLGSVVVEADWRADVEGLRTELHRVLSEDDLWDGRVGVLQVTDAVGSVLQLRALVSAADAGATFDLRCHVREALVGWLVEHPSGLPHVRQLNSEDTSPSRREAPAGRAPTGWELPERAPAAGGAGADGPGGAGGRGPDTGSGRRVGSRGDSLFTGSPEAEERARQFSGPSDDDRGAREEHRADVPATTGATRGVPARPAQHDGRDGHDLVDRQEQPPTTVLPAVVVPAGVGPDREAGEGTHDGTDDPRSSAPTRAVPRREPFGDA